MKHVGMIFITLLLAIVAAVSSGSHAVPDDDLAKRADHDTSLQPICFHGSNQQSSSSSNLWKSLRGGACFRYGTVFPFPIGTS